MSAAVEIFGIRHHGPGSARRLAEALEELRPSMVLIEGPADATPLLPMLADPAMVPPVALLAYDPAESSKASFWPFARFSPEYQATLWAARNQVEARFIDLPSYWRMADEAPPEAPILRDPIGALAQAAGYEDGESWWRDVIEENPDPGPVFAAVTEAMAALRAEAPAPEGFKAAREAHMRLEIDKARKAVEGVVAVVCGAWHAPALTEKHALKDDRALLKGAPKRKVSLTWTPWTAPRLAFSTGYGAGVAAPGWCAHLWDSPPGEAALRWLTKIAGQLREEGQVVSTASLIEAHRLATTLAALRDRPAPGFEELRDAATACLGFGQSSLWDAVAGPLLIGSEVGEIPPDAPHAPLLEDLQRQQKAARLKPEAQDRELSLDLRSDSGLFRSTLLRRLTLLGAPWGRLTDAGRSRGTFRERWLLRWEPEFSAALVEGVVYGPDIEQAADGRLRAQLEEAETLAALADMAYSAMAAQLPRAAAAASDRLGARAAQTSDCLELLNALPPLADLVRYGEARAGDLSQTAALTHRITVQGALALPYAARGLDAEAAGETAAATRKADAALRLISAGDGASLPHDALESWETALSDLLANDQSARLVAGSAAQLLYAAERLSPEDAGILLARMLSPAVDPAEAAAFFEGFFQGAAQRLLYDPPLREAVDAWIVSLDDDAFVNYLPLFRRVFAALDRMERKRLLDALFKRGGGGMTGLALAPNADEIWAAHLPVLTEILTLEPADG